MGASSPAIRPEQRRLAAARGPGDRQGLPGRHEQVQRMQDRQRSAAALHGARDAAQLDHRSSCVPSTSGSSARQMVSAITRCPSAVGWMPSAWFSVAHAGDAFEEERDQRARRAIGGDSRYTARKSRVYAAPKFGGASMPSSRTAHAAAPARSAMIVARFALELRRRQPAQAIVGAERHDQHAHVALRATTRDAAVRRPTCRRRRRR